MSDGATQSGRSNESAVTAAVQAHVPIDTIAFGTDHGVVTIPEAHAQVPVTVDRGALAQIARSSGGHAYTAASEAQIRAVYSRIGTSIGYRTVRKDISGWFVGIGFVFLVGAAAASLLGRTACSDQGRAGAVVNPVNRTLVPGWRWPVAAGVAGVHPVGRELCVEGMLGVGVARFRRPPRPELEVESSADAAAQTCHGGAANLLGSPGAEVTSR